MNRHLPILLVTAIAAAVALPQVVTANVAAVGDLQGSVNLAVADVTTGGVVISSPTAATVTATIDPNSVGTQYYFEYGTNGQLTLRTPTVSLGAGLDPRQVTADLLGLEPGTTYEYRAVAAGPGGLSVGPALSFQTAASSVPGAGKGSRALAFLAGPRIASGVGAGPAGERRHCRRVPVHWRPPIHLTARRGGRSAVAPRREDVAKS